VKHDWFCTYLPGREILTLTGWRWDDLIRVECLRCGYVIDCRAPQDSECVPADSRVE